MRRPWTGLAAALLLAITIATVTAQDGGPLLRLRTVAVMPFDDSVQAVGVPLADGEGTLGQAPSAPMCSVIADGPKRSRGSLVRPR